ncbi:DUF4333 domain-containing protein [Streptomyces sp. NPDC001820]|uniref:DUF4333 domain-containing protein n=1 Tax=Streptomyces sp. NPDC001820 TaxID=3364613 RepID=UPI0036B0D49B
MIRNGAPVTIARLPVATWSLSAVAACALLVGCSASVTVGNSEPKLSSDKLATTVSEKLAATTGQPKPDITCPEDLVGKIGTTTRCTLTAKDGSTLGVSATVTSVDGKEINFDIKADETASPAAN